MADTCERCGRPYGYRAHECDDDATCADVVAAYERGRRDGIAHAKATAKVADIADRSPMSGDVIDWTETDKDERGTP